MKYVEILEEDLERLLGVIEYVVRKEGDTIDAAMLGFLREELRSVRRHLETESSGVEVASEISMILDFIGDSNGWRTGHRDP